MIRGILTFLFIYAQFSLFGQRHDLTQTFTPSTFIDTIPAGLAVELRNRNQANTSKIHDNDRKVESLAREISKKQVQESFKLFNSDQVSTNPDLSASFSRIIARLENAFKSEKENAIPFISGNSAVNALSTGEGVVICNAGLVARIQTEDQLAFVAGHELAHYYLNHTTSSISMLANFELDKKTKEYIRSVKNSQYNKYTLMSTLVRNLTLSFGMHSREHEFEADSLGVELMIKAGYNPFEAISALEILDGADISLNKNLIDLKKYFDFKEHPFKKEWLVYSNNTLYRAPREKSDSDTTRSHPNCKRRMAAVNTILQSKHLTEIPSTRDSVSILTSISEFEQIESEYHLKQYGRSLFFTLLQLEKYPENAYLHAMVGNNLYEIFQSQKKHVFSKVVIQPDYTLDENYNRLITFLHALRATDIERIANLYIITKKEEYFEDENFLFAFWKVSHLPSSVMEPELVKKEYANKFPNGRFINNMK